jgi:hypothetical protein
MNVEFSINFRFGGPSWHFPITSVGARSSTW